LTGAVRLGLALLLVALAGCASDPGETSTTTSTGAPSTTTSTTLGNSGSLELGSPTRPAQLVAPAEVTAPAPLVVFLHGYASDATGHDAYLGVTDQARRRGLYVLLPEGTTSPRGRQFWDATSACCNFTGTPVDDVAYLQDLIDEAIATRPIDPDRVYVFGHSNGGFMAYRLACERADQVAAVASLAGADQLDEQACEPTEAVSVLHLHGTDDDVVSYDGGPSLLPVGDETVQPGTSRAYPGAVDTVQRWATRSGCDPEPVQGQPVDLDAGIDGAETAVATYRGCDDGAEVELGTIEGGGHVPRLPHEVVGSAVLDWLLDQSR
jgi:polyhydroxybutyrate depolymerase